MARYRIRIIPALLLLLAADASLSRAETTLLCFSSPSCGPCQQMQPTLQRLAQAGHRLQKIDVTRNRQAAAQYRVKSVPTFVVLVDNREMARLRGWTDEATLLGMISKSEHLAGVGRPRTPATLATNPFPGLTGTAAGRDAEEGRIVKVQAEGPPRGRLLGATARNGATAGGQKDLIAVTVKLSVDDPQGQSNGTGTIVDAREGQALVLTCGHLFRDSGGSGAIMVTLYESSASGPVQRATVPGKLIDYDLDRDLGLVAIRPGVAVQAAAIAPVGTATAPGEAVTSVGCNQGADPTVLRSRVTTVDRYSGHPNLQVAGAPIEGRSGGGLFNSRGQLVGVCFAADPAGNEGLYAAARSIHTKLDALQLSMVHRSPSLKDGPAGGVAPATALAASTQPPAAIAAPASPVSVRGQNSLAPSASRQLSPEEQAGLEEIVSRAVQSEVVVVVRPKEPGGKSEVFTLRDVSPAFLARLREAQPGRSTNAAAGALLR